MAHDEKPVGIASVLGDMVMHPADGLGDVANDGRHVHARQEPVVCGDKDEPFVHESLRLNLDTRFVARLPTAAVNPENHRQVFGIMRRINIEHLTLVRRIGVGDVAFDVLGSRFGKENDGNKKMEDVIHGVHPYPGSKVDIALNLGMQGSMLIAFQI
jgi:hypothetical protein